MLEKFKKRKDFSGEGADSAKSIEKEFKFHLAWRERCLSSLVLKFPPVIEIFNIIFGILD